MNLDEAIRHAEDVAIGNAMAGKCDCAKEHRQLAEWLKELKYYRNLLYNAYSGSVMYGENRSNNGTDVLG